MQHKMLPSFSSLWSLLTCQCVGLLYWRNAWQA